MEYNIIFKYNIFIFFLENMLYMVWFEYRLQYIFIMRIMIYIDDTIIAFNEIKFGVAEDLDV